MTILVPSHYEDDPWLVTDDHLRGRFMAGWGWSVPSHCEEMIHGRSRMVTCGEHEYLLHILPILAHLAMKMTARRIPPSHLFSISVKLSSPASPKANLNTGPREEHVANHAGGRRGVVWECYHQRTQEAAHHGCMDQPRKSILAIHLWRGFMTYKPIDLGVHFPVKQMFIADNTKTMIGTLRLQGCTLELKIWCLRIEGSNPSTLEFEHVTCDGERKR
ncbi:uncharacterized protein LOC119355336 [Triticum dicoccoides]|uniref:uncharacterized protein LOC119355336 n=1 Tax=Triticum dicoccoides TaxID=85692 RepID=UPI000E7A679B|nr:uncharacterized protein LOC119355336 [Triticum dicoccoides]